MITMTKMYDKITVFLCGCIETENAPVKTLRFKCNSHKKHGYLTKNWQSGEIIFTGDLIKFKFPLPKPMYTKERLEKNDP